MLTLFATPMYALQSSYEIAAASENPSNGRQAVGPDQADESSKAIKKLTSVLLGSCHTRTCQCKQLEQSFMCKPCRDVQEAANAKQMLCAVLDIKQ